MSYDISPFHEGTSLKTRVLQAGVAVLANFLLAELLYGLVFFLCCLTGFHLRTGTPLTYHSNGSGSVTLHECSAVRHVVHAYAGGSQASKSDLCLLTIGLCSLPPLLVLLRAGPLADRRTSAALIPKENTTPEGCA